MHSVILLDFDHYLLILDFYFACLQWISFLYPPLLLLFFVAHTKRERERKNKKDSKINGKRNKGGW